MIVFHEGLPGSGKSYEACIMHILPAIQAGRDVLTNINGINHAKFAEITGIPERFVRESLVCITHDDIDDEDHRLEAVKESILELTKKDSLVVIDEIQDLHPTGRQKLPPKWSKYIASHRHEGLDIVLMGQDRRDVHPLWRRRINRIITFNKLEAVGQPNRYRWECYSAKRPEVFAKTTQGVRKYDKKYFGLYKSHTDGTANTDVYKDNRSNVLKSPTLKYGAIATVIAMYFAFSYLTDFFGTPAQAEETQVQAEEPEKSTEPPTASQDKQAPIAPANPVQQQEPVEPEEPPPIDQFDADAGRYRPRLAGVVSTPDFSEFTAQIDIMTNSGHRHDSYTVAALRDLGWTLTLRDSGLHAKKEGVEHLIRPWPMDTVYGQVNRSRRENL